VWPGAVLILLGVALTTVAADASWLEQAVDRYPLIISAGGLLLAWRFRRSRVGAVLLGLVLVDHLLRPSDVDSGGIVLLLGIGVLAVLKDRGLFSWLGALQALGLGLAMAVGLAIRHHGVPWTWTPLPGWVPPDWLDLSRGAVVAGVLSLSATLLMAIRRSHPVEKGLFWTVVAVLLALSQGADSVGSTVHVAVGTLVLALAVVEMSYAMAFRDELTGLPARRALWQEIDSAGRSYAVAMVDVDHFKKFNDRHGHDVGDQILRLVAAQLGKVTGGGRAFRYGGEEFTVVFPGKGRDEALPHLEELRRRIDASRFAVRRVGRPRTPPAVKKTKKRPPRRLSVTVSIGVAERSEKAPTGEAVVKRADKALYRAKKAGRNRVAK